MVITHLPQKVEIFIFFSQNLHLTNFLWFVISALCDRLRRNHDLKPAWLCKATKCSLFTKLFAATSLQLQLFPLGCSHKSHKIIAHFADKFAQDKERLCSSSGVSWLHAGGVTSNSATEQPANHTCRYSGTDRIIQRVTRQTGSAANKLQFKPRTIGHFSTLLSSI